MTLKEELVSAIFNEDIIEAVELMFSEDEEVKLFDYNDITLKLYKGSSEAICLEIFVDYQDFDKDTGINRIIRFNTPICFYFQSNDSTTDVSAVILGYVENECNDLIEFTDFFPPINIEFLTLEENALIGAFSAESVIHIKKLKNCKFEANGYNFHITLAEDGDPQVFLDEEYDLDGDNCFAIYYKNEGMIRVPEDYGDEYNPLYYRRIFSMNKFVK